LDHDGIYAFDAESTKRLTQPSAPDELQIHALFARSGDNDLTQYSLQQLLPVVICRRLSRPQHANVSSQCDKFVRSHPGDRAVLTATSGLETPLQFITPVNRPLPLRCELSSHSLEGRVSVQVTLTRGLDLIFRMLNLPALRLQNVTRCCELLLNCREGCLDCGRRESRQDRLADCLVYEARQELFPVEALAVLVHASARIRRAPVTCLVTPVQRIHPRVTLTTPQQSLKLTGTIADRRAYGSPAGRKYLLNLLKLFATDIRLMMILRDYPFVLGACRHTHPFVVRRKM
jgi:hypothetical protein